MRQVMVEDDEEGAWTAGAGLDESAIVNNNNNKRHNNLVDFVTVLLSFWPGEYQTT